MAVVSSTVNSGELATATQYNNLRTDAVGSTGHDHGSGQGNATISATTFDGTATVSAAWNFTGAVGIDSSVDADVTDFDLASSGDIDLVSTNDAASAIYLRENAGTSGTIKIHADQGTSESSIQLLSDAGGVDINAATGKDVDIAGGTVNLTSSDNAASAIYLRANAGTSETIKIHADQGTGTGSIELLSDAGGIELDAGTDIILDAGGADIFLKDDGTLFGTLTNSSGELRIKSSSSGTTAATFTGANVVFAGTVDATTDFTIGTTVITDDSIVMTPSPSDTVTIAGATHGILNVTTVDAAGTAADVNIDADGEIVIDAADAAGTIFKIAGTAQVNVVDGGIVPETTNDIDLGTSSLEFKDAWFDGTVTADAFAGPLTGNVTGDASGTAGIATTVTITDNESTNENNAIIFTAGGDLNGGNLGLESDGDLHYNPSTGLLTTTGLTASGTVSAEQLTSTDDLSLTGDSAVFNMGAGNDFTITHDGTTGATLAGNPITITSGGAATWSTSAGALTITSAAAATWSTGAGVLTIDGDDGIVLSTGGSGDLQINENVFINDDTNVGMTLGLTINQGAADDQILAFKSSDVGHGMTARTGGSGSDDTFAYFKKSTAGTTGGGLVISALTESINGVTIQSAATSANTTKGRGGSVAILMDCQLKDGTGVTTYVGGGDNTGTDGNLWGVADQAAGLVCMVDTEGQLYAVANAHAGDVSVGAIADSYDDAQLVRALDHAKTSAGARGLIRSRWDDFISYREQDLIDAGILGDTLENDGMLNVTGLQRLHNGAIWQGYVRQQEMQERIEVMETKLLALQEAN
jgi:hypothetical protein